MECKRRLIFTIVISLMLLTFGISQEQSEGVPVLIYHNIMAGSEEPGETVISLEKFKQQMAYLYENGYAAISADDLVRYMKGGVVPKKAVVLTFDDGWQNVTTIVPILKGYHFKASFFILAGREIHRPPYMSWADVSAIAKDPDFQICSHTMTHPWDVHSNLVTWIAGKTVGKDASDVRYELEESKKVIEQALHQKIRYLAWPMGWYNEELIGMAKNAGYDALFTVEDGPNLPGGDVFRIKRVFVDGACDMAAFQQTLQDSVYRVCQGKRKPTLGHLPGN
jgi:peptidoglycan/xylan/chitin deacetylase (PgdA/CDA1 family)